MPLFLAMRYAGFREDAVNVIRHPIGLRDVSSLQLAIIIVLIVEDNAQLVQHFDPAALIGTPFNPRRITIVGVLFIDDVIGVHRFQLCFEVKPNDGKLVVDVRQMGKRGSDCLLQIGYPPLCRRWG